MTITKTSDKISIEGHVGKWHVISKARCQRGNEPAFVELYLLEHSTYGDDAESLIVNQNGEIVLAGVFDGWSDMVEDNWTILNEEWNS